MILTCPKCQSQYKLADEKLGPGGRTVRCHDCHHTWYQMPEIVADTMPQEQTPVVDQKAAAEIESVLEAALANDAPAALGDILTDAAKAADGAPQPVARTSMPPKVEDAAPVVMHNPFGVSATSFGILSFFLCFSITLTTVILVKNPVLKKWPQVSLLYKTLGVHTHAPGEGLRLSEVTAEQRVDKPKELLVEGKLTNMSEAPMFSPPLQIVIRDDKRAVVKEIRLKAAGKQLASGESLPMMLQLPDVPEDAVTIEMRAIAE